MRKFFNKKVKYEITKPTRIFLGLVAFCFSSCFFVIGISASEAQDVNFSLYQFTPTLVNPASVGAYSTSQVFLGYRSQWRSIDGKYSTPILTGILPFLNKTGMRKGGIGFTAYNDKAGQTIYSQTTGVNLSLAYNAKLGKTLQVSFGANGGFNQRKLSFDNALTESQYNGTAGLNSGLSNGEEGGTNAKNYFDIGAGLLLYADNEVQRRKYYFGVAGYHLTQPSIGLGSTKEKLPIKLIGTAGFLLLNKTNFSITPEVLYSSMASNQRILVGAQLRYYFTNTENKLTKGATIAFIPRYSLNDALIFAFEFNKKYATLGLSFDYTLSGLNAFNKGKGATEIFLALSIPSKKKKQPVAEIEDYNVGQAREFIVQKTDEPDNTKSYVLHLQEVIPFAFNDTTLSKESKATINDVASLIKGNKYLKVRIIGHSDNLGSNKRNQQISEERAQRVADYLVLSGIPRNRIKIVARGADEPLKPNDTEQGRAMNRRVEFELYK